MTRDTGDLIAQLAAETRRVRRLPAPWLRALVWLAIIVPYAAVVVLAHGAPAPAESIIRFAIGQTATLATAFTATLAAFATIVPGYNRRLLVLPVVPLALWLGSVGYGCLQDWVQLGPGSLTIRPDWDCLQPAAILGVVPALALAFMLRKGAALQPRVTVALAGLAVAAFTNFGLQFFHARDASIMVLVWHVGGAFLFAGLGGLLGERVLRWRPSLT